MAEPSRLHRHLLCSKQIVNLSADADIHELCVLQWTGQRGQRQQRLDHGDYDRPQSVTANFVAASLTVSRQRKFRQRQTVPNEEAVYT